MPDEVVPAVPVEPEVPPVSATPQEEVKPEGEPEPIVAPTPDLEPEPEPVAVAPATDLAKQLKEAEREAYLANKRAKYWLDVSQQALAGKEPVGDEPLPEAFDDLAQFNTVHTTWAVKRALDEESQKRILSAQQAQAREIYEAQVEKVNAVVARDPGFVDTAHTVASLGVHPGLPMYEGLFECDNFEGVMKHLAGHPEEVRRIKELSPTRQIREIVKLDSQVKVVVPPPKKVTAAPTPAAPTVKTGGGMEKGFDEMSQEEYFRFMNAKEGIKNY